MTDFEPNQDVSDKFSLRGKVYHKLKEDILDGKYKDGDELREIALSEEMGVSRTPLREAMRQLELEKLVKIIPNKGAYVTGITEKDVRDIYMIRSALEGICARLATENITEEQLEAMEENVYLAEFHASRDHMEQLAELDNKFHHILYDASDSKMLQNVLEEYHQYVIRIRRKTLSRAQRGRASNEEHRAIMEAIKCKDAQEAARLATLHINNAFDNIKLEGV